MPSLNGGRPMQARLVHAVAAAALATGLVLLSAGPALADAAGPGDYRSEVTGIVPASEGVDAEIRGGDSFLELTVEPGHTVIVEGYSGEPYLRFLPDGTVERNRLSSATYLNDDRRADVTVPDDAEAATRDGAEPDWESVANGGTYAWHDHRVHWMDDATPPVARGERLTGAYDPWRVPIVVDGVPAEVQGTLTYERAVSPLPWAGLALVCGGALAWLGRGRGLRLPAGVLAAVSAAAVVVGRADWTATPGGANPLLWALPVVALLTAVVALVFARAQLGRRPGAGVGRLAVGVGPAPRRGPAEAHPPHGAAVRRGPDHPRCRARRQRGRRLPRHHQRRPHPPEPRRRLTRAGYNQPMRLKRR